MAVLFVALPGCGNLGLLRQGEPAFNTQILLPEPSASPQSRITGARGADVTGPLQIPAVCSPPSSDSANVKSCVYAMKTIIDDYYREYWIVLHQVSDGGNAVADIASLGLTTAATAAGGTAARILAGIATGVGGTKNIINEDVLYKHSIDLVLTQMDTDREHQFTIMLKEMNGTPGSYPIDAAMNDLMQYFIAGTFEHALASLDTTVAANRAGCKRQLEKTKVAVTSQTPAPTTDASATDASGCSPTSSDAAKPAAPEGAAPKSPAKPPVAGQKPAP